MLIPFTFTGDKTDAVDKPPDDALARASWLHMVLCRMLYDVMNDDTLSAAEKREAAAVLATKITQATPNHEIHQARRKIVDDERATEQAAKLDGKVSASAKTGHAGNLRTDAPRGRGKT